MIDITFSRDDDKKTLTLIVSGHAGQNDYGKDIVCASASMLAYTLVHHMQTEAYKGIYSECRHAMKNGYALMTCTATDDAGYTTALHLFDVIVTGYDLLAQNYPQFVKLTRFGQA